MFQGIRFVGFVVSKATIAVAVAEQDGSVTEYGTIANDPSAVRRVVRTLGEDCTLRTAYEAGPTGYALHRQLASLGIENIVVAPSLIPRRPGDRVKTDRRDALQLARLLRNGDLTPVWVPDEQHEALRDLVRARDDANADLLREKHHLAKFLLRRGLATPATAGKLWSQRYQSWIATLAFRDRAAEITFHDYVAAVRTAEQRVRRLEAALLEVGTAGPHADLVGALQALRGVGFLTAVTIVAEAGDLRRFPKASAFMSYVGLVPSEYSSGASVHRGHLTKTGNRLLRHVLGEAAHHARFNPMVSATLRRRQEGLDAAVVDISWRCQLRLHHTYRKLSARGNRPRMLSAVARELAGFVWSIGQVTEVPAA